MKTNNKVSVERLREVLDYDSATGRLWWKETLSNRNGENMEAGGPKSGYWRIAVDGHRFRAHRVAWAIYYGEWPESEIDHINRDKLDNRIENLRLVERGVNVYNTGLRKDNTSGHSGVRMRKDTGKWEAKITVKKKIITLGSFSDVESAIKVRKEAELKYYGELSEH